MVAFYNYGFAGGESGKKLAIIIGVFIALAIIIVACSFLRRKGVGGCFSSFCKSMQ
jgi:hypothetical protein